MDKVPVRGRGVESSYLTYVTRQDRHEFLIVFPSMLSRKQLCETFQAVTFAINPYDFCRWTRLVTSTTGDPQHQRLIAISRWQPRLGEVRCHQELQHGLVRTERFLRPQVDPGWIGWCRSPMVKTGSATTMAIEITCNGCGRPMDSLPSL